ncbi:MAG: hypothetical protein ABI114_16505 [Rhodanobacter sp.]
MSDNDDQKMEHISRYLQAVPASVPQALCQAIAAGLSNQIEPDTLHAWFTKFGQQWAIQIQPQLAQVDSLEKLADCINAYWAEQRWGWIELTELADRVVIRHRAYPLSHLFGEDQLSWSVGLLEGFYRQVFEQIGADSGMQLRATHYSEDGFDLHLELTS